MGEGGGGGGEEGGEGEGDEGGEGRTVGVTARGGRACSETGDKRGRRERMRL